MTVDGSGAGWPGGPSQAALSFESLVANLAEETLELNGLTLEFLGITMAGSLSGQRLMSDLALTGAVDIREFAPRERARARSTSASQTADDAVLTRASAKANLLYNSSQIGLRDMQLKLDDSTLTGRVALEGERLTYDLTVDDINVDRYLPPSEEADAPAEEGLARRGRSAARRAAHARRARRAQVRPSEVQRPDADQRRVRAERRQRRRAAHAERAALRRPRQRATFACRSKPTRRA